jgi:hypothetical protein
VEPAATSAPRECAAAVFQRVKPFAKRVIVDVAQLCQPLWAFPWLNDYDTAKEFFRGKVNKWDADQWLVCDQLF